MATQDNNEQFICTVQPDISQQTFGTKRTLEEHQAECRVRKAARRMLEAQQRQDAKVLQAARALRSTTESEETSAAETNVYDQDYGLDYGGYYSDDECTMAPAQDDGEALDDEQEDDHGEEMMILPSETTEHQTGSFFDRKLLVDLIFAGKLG